MGYSTVIKLIRVHIIKLVSYTVRSGWLLDHRVGHQGRSSSVNNSSSVSVQSSPLQVGVVMCCCVVPGPLLVYSVERCGHQWSFCNVRGMTMCALRCVFCRQWLFLTDTKRLVAMGPIGS